MTGRSH